MDKYEYCENIIKKTSTTFHEAFSQLDTQKANAVYAIYAFCRTADDAIDVDRDIEKIHSLKKDVKRTFEGDVPNDPLFEALYETIMRYPASVSPYLDLLDGMQDDYYDKPIETEKDFDAYCYKAASTVGIMLLPVIASKNYKNNSKNLKIVATELGKAMQITNILRDVREDLKNQRVYFPSELLEKYNVNLETLRTGITTPEYVSLIEYYIDLAKKKYKVFYDNLELFDEDSLYPTLVAALFYEGILDEIRKANHDNLTKHHYVGKFRKWKLLRQAKKMMKSRRG